MGGLYITPNSSDMSWKRRGLRVSSEALLCIGVATIVASFVIDINPDGSKPNIWILIGGVIMILAAAIGWALTFCLIWENVSQQQTGSSRNPNAAVHSIQVVVPDDKLGGKIKVEPTYGGGSYLASTVMDTVTSDRTSSGGRRSVEVASKGRKSKDNSKASSNKGKTKDKRKGKSKSKTQSKKKGSYTNSSSSGISSNYSSTDKSSEEQIKSYV